MGNKHKGGSLFDYGETGYSEIDTRPVSDRSLGSPENSITTVGTSPTMEHSSVWGEPSISSEDKFVDIPTNIIDKNTYNTLSIEPLKTAEIPLYVIYNNKKHKVKEIGAGSTMKWNKITYGKYQKLIMMLIYLCTSTIGKNIIDVDFYIRENKLEDLLIEV